MRRESSSASTGTACQPRRRPTRRRVAHRRRARPVGPTRRTSAQHRRHELTQLLRRAGERRTRHLYRQLRLASGCTAVHAEFGNHAPLRHQRGAVDGAPGAAFSRSLVIRPCSVGVGRVPTAAAPPGRRAVRFPRWSVPLRSRRTPTRASGARRPAALAQLLFRSFVLLYKATGLAVEAALGSSIVTSGPCSRGR